MNPKKTIKNIIKEELDDMQWIIDTEPLSISNKNWIIHNDVNNSEDEERRIQEWIYSQGYVWPDDLGIENMLDGDCEYYFNVDEVYFDAYIRWNDELGNMITHNSYELFNWSSIRKQLNINESEEEKDPFNWINEIPAGIELQPDTLYYFEPKLTWDELPNFANRIINSEYIKGWLFRRLTGRFTNEQEGIKYFVTSNKVNNIDGWCTEASPYDDWARIIYGGKDYVNARETFYL